jgi:hypothetical protein
MGNIARCLIANAVTSFFTAQLRKKPLPQTVSEYKNHPLYVKTLFVCKQSDCILSIDYYIYVVFAFCVVLFHQDFVGFYIGMF